MAVLFLSGRVKRLLFALQKSATITTIDAEADKKTGGKCIRVKNKVKID